MKDVQLIGKIEESNLFGKTWITLLITPAPDSYSQPSTFKLKSDAALGSPGDEIKATCDISGYIRRRPYKDKDTGQQKTFVEDTVNFSVTKVEPIRANIKAAS